MTSPASSFFAALLLTVPGALSAQAQINSVTRRTVQGTDIPPELFKVTAPIVPQTTYVWIVREKSPEQRAELVRKTVEFQQQRAAGGSAQAQYDLGMRYLNGDGVELNRALAREWLRASAKNGHTQAKEKLAALEPKKESP